MSPDGTQQAFDLLNNQLSQLFGFADGVSDVVEHLLTIDSKDVSLILISCQSECLVFLMITASEQDLSEYLEQLLGSATSKQKTFHNFVDNLLRYQRGQELIVEESKADPVILKVVEPALDNDKKVSAPLNTKSAAKAKVTERKIQKVPLKATLPTTRKSSPSQRNSTKQRTQPQQTQILTPPKADFRKLSSLPKPPIGDAQVKSCGCFGTQHSVIVNCLYCGRISCSAEADILFCPGCRYQLHSKDDPVRIEWCVVLLMMA